MGEVRETIKNIIAGGDTAEVIAELENVFSRELCYKLDMSSDCLGALDRPDFVAVIEAALSEFCNYIRDGHLR
jgi:hypothetical protein